MALKVLRGKPREVLLHDEGGVVSEPLYLLQFTQWAAENGLAYIADTDLRLDLLTLLPEPVQREIAARKMPRLKALQYVDYLRNCPFRSSLLCRSDDAIHGRTHPDAQALLDLHIQSLLAPEQPLDTQDDSLGRFRLLGQPFVADTIIWRCAQVECSVEATSEQLDAIARLILESVCLGRMKLTLGPIVTGQ